MMITRYMYITTANDFFFLLIFIILVAFYILYLCSQLFPTFQLVDSLEYLNSTPKKKKAEYHLHQ